ncbi:hypothetical protein CSUI_006865 [Cystoisospora suis]|uniref:Transmembrane protein n=1 Tax=Cystoisospora suis TaxID=483139 RepID=A0A2C6KSZ1_9APIC|nr:hypothetical protein CSUI_006865 [Cystoisospora suis]
MCRVTMKTLSGRSRTAALCSPKETERHGDTQPLTRSDGTSRRTAPRSGDNASCETEDTKLLSHCKAMTIRGEDAAENARPIGITDGKKMAVDSGTLTSVGAVEEKGTLMGEGRFSDERAARSRTRSLFGRRRFVSSRRHTASKVSIVAAALGIISMSFVAVRFIECLGALRARGTIHGGLSLGVTPRKLAGSPVGDTENDNLFTVEKCLGAYGSVDSASSSDRIDLEPREGPAAGDEEARLTSANDGETELSGGDDGATGLLSSGDDSLTWLTSSEDVAVKWLISNGVDTPTWLMLDGHAEATGGPMSGGDDEATGGPISGEDEEATGGLKSGGDEEATGLMSGKDEKTRALMSAGNEKAMGGLTSAEAGSEGDEGVPEVPSAQTVLPRLPLKAKVLARQKQLLARRRRVRVGLLAVITVWLMVAGLALLALGGVGTKKPNGALTFPGFGLAGAGAVMLIITFKMWLTEYSLDRGESL